MSSVCSLEEGGHEADRGDGDSRDREAEEPQASAVHHAHLNPEEIRRD
jgi:hypothetical protein